MPTSGVQLSNTFRYFYSSARRWCHLFGVSAQTDIVVLGIWHSLYTLPEVIVPTSGVTHSPTLSGICTLTLGRGLASLLNLSSD